MIVVVERAKARLQHVLCCVALTITSHPPHPFSLSFGRIRLIQYKGWQISYRTLIQKVLSQLER